MRLYFVVHASLRKPKPKNTLPRFLRISRAGINEAIALRKVLQKEVEQFDYIISSTFACARQTAYIIGKKFPDVELQELYPEKEKGVLELAQTPLIKHIGSHNSPTGNLMASLGCAGAVRLREELRTAMPSTNQNILIVGHPVVLHTIAHRFGMFNIPHDGTKPRVSFAPLADMDPKPCTGFVMTFGAGWELKHIHLFT